MVKKGLYMLYALNVVLIVTFYSEKYDPLLMFGLAGDEFNLPVQTTYGNEGVLIAIPESADKAVTFYKRNLVWRSCVKINYLEAGAVPVLGSKVFFYEPQDKKVKVCTFRSKVTNMSPYIIQPNEYEGVLIYMKKRIFGFISLTAIIFVLAISTIYLVAKRNFLFYVFCMFNIAFSFYNGFYAVKEFGYLKELEILLGG